MPILPFDGGFDDLDFPGLLMFTFHLLYINMFEQILEHLYIIKNTRFISLLPDLPSLASRSTRKTHGTTTYIPRTCSPCP